MKLQEQKAELLKNKVNEQVARREEMNKTGYGAPEIKGVPLSDNALKQNIRFTTELKKVQEFLNAGNLPENAPQEILDVVDSIYDEAGSLKYDLEQFDF